MILVDTSVWIDHLRHGEPLLVRLLEEQAVCTHPMIVGELAMGSLRRRQEVLAALAGLPQLGSATSDEVAWLIERHALYGRGLSLVDAHLLASLLISGRDRLWSRDRRLGQAAEELKVLVKSA